VSWKVIEIVISFCVRESEAPPQWVIIKWIGGRGNLCDLIEEFEERGF
jgi:hypothetical protein